MTRGYFHQINRETATRVWINNPTGADLDSAIAAGAINCTTNPSYCSKLLQNEPEYIRPIIDSVIREVENDAEAADLVYQRVCARLMGKFFPLYEKSGWTQGFVTMQDDPHRDEEPRDIIQAALRHCSVGKNFMAKIPVIESGMEAMSDLVERDIPICATECFSIAQTIAMCDLYEQVSKKCDKHPTFFITHITGIYDEEIKDYATKNNVDIALEVLSQAGCIVARKEYQLIKERGYATTILGGGARANYHFTELVGGDVHVTLNWSTMKELIDADGPIVSRIDAQDSQEVIEELYVKIPDFRRAYDEDGLTPAEFKEFAPLLRFRNIFIKGYDHLLKEIAERRVLASVK